VRPDRHLSASECVSSQLTKRALTKVDEQRLTTNDALSAPIAPRTAVGIVLGDVFPPRISQF
jgi:hypothetical protein